MHAGIKLIFGLILILLGLWLLVPFDISAFEVIKSSDSIFNWWPQFKTVVLGVIPPIVIVLGILIVWIESEELKSPVVPEPKVEPVSEKPAKKKRKPAKKKK